MGAEASCTATYNGQRSEGTALLETDYLLFRGDFRVKVSFRDILQLAADGEDLIVITRDGELNLQLGAAAIRWKDKIQNPPSLLKKLGVKPGLRIAVENVRDEQVIQDLGPVADTGKVDLFLLGVDTAEELKRVRAAKTRLATDGGLWVVYPKGQKHIREGDVINAGRTAGLKDVKVAAFSATHTALKFVIPLPARK
jgi:hypothetical protein